MRGFSAGHLALLLTIVYPALCLLGDQNIPKSYFADKNNFLNQYFVKWAWGWTLCVITPFLILSGCILWKEYPLLIVRDFTRLVVGTLIWCLWVSLFFYIENVTGNCSTSGYPNKKTCKKAGYKWDGYDISGHSFLLIYSALLIHEELQAYWIVKDANDNASWFKSITTGAKQLFGYKTPVNENLKGITELLARLQPFLSASGIIALVIELLWLFMLVWTALYFHSADHKIIGGIIAIGSWFLTYKVWYKSSISPGQPGRLV